MFHNKSVAGFYLPCIASILSFAVSLTYIFSYQGTSYFNILPFLFSLLGTLVFFGLIFVPKTKRFASLGLEIFAFLSLLSFIRHTYLYLSTVFYDGVTMEAISSLSPAFVFIFLALILTVVLANIGIYVSPERKENRSHE